MDTIKIDKKNVRMVAHACLAGMESGNTVAGMIAAGNRSYWGVECDVRMAKDGFVVIHNQDTAGISPTSLIVSESTVEQLQSICLYDRPFFYGMEQYGLTAASDKVRADLRIPTLQEYVRVCKRYGKVCVTELKQVFSPQAIAGIVQVFAEQEYLDSVVFISFYKENLDEIRKHLPQCPVQLLTDEKQDFTDDFLDRIAKDGFDLDIHIFTTTKELVERIHARGIKVNVWTCDWQDRAEQLIAWDVDYITSNIFE